MKPIEIAEVAYEGWKAYAYLRGESGIPKWRDLDDTPKLPYINAVNQCMKDPSPPVIDDPWVFIVHTIVIALLKHLQIHGS